MEKDTVSMYFVGAAVARLADDARSRVLAAAGIPQDLLAASNARVPAQAFAALWLAVARELDDEFFGLDSRRMKIGSFALLCQAVLHTDNLDRAIKRMLRGFSAFLDDVAADLRLAERPGVNSVANPIPSSESGRVACRPFLFSFSRF